MLILFPSRSHVGYTGGPRKEGWPQRPRPKRPSTKSQEGKRLAVESIDDRVEEEGEWWEPEAVFKMHYRVTLEDGRQVAIFRNMKTGSWYWADPNPSGNG